MTSSNIIKNEHSRNYANCKNVNNMIKIQHNNSNDAESNNSSNKLCTYHQSTTAAIKAC